MKYTRVEALKGNILVYDVSDLQKYEIKYCATCFDSVVCVQCGKMYGK